MAAKIQRLSNNIPVIVEEMPYLRSVTLGVYIGSGSANENKENNGIAHAIEHMLFKGTNKHTASELADIMTEMGGGINAYTSKENTVFYGKVLTGEFEAAAALLAEMIKESLINAKELAKEKHVIIDEIDSYDDSAEDMCHELLQKMVWKDNPLGYIISGTKTNVKSFKREQLIKFLQDNYTADNMVISVAGQVEASAVTEVFEKYFSDIPKKGKKLVPKAPDFNKCFLVRYKDMEQVHLNIAFDNVTNGHEDRYAMFMINSLLGGNLNSSLFQKVREENGLTYSIYSYNSMCDLAGLFHIYASMNSNQAEKVLRLIYQVIEELYEKGIDEEELIRLKRQTKTELILGSETASSTVLNNARTFMTGGNVISLDEAVRGYENVTLDQLNRCIRTYLRLDKCSICMVGNTKEADINKMKKMWNSHINNQHN